jgi:hypothetical protein
VSATPKTHTLSRYEFNGANSYYNRAADRNIEAAGAWAANDAAAGKDLEQRARAAMSSGVLVRAPPLRIWKFGTDLP